MEVSKWLRQLAMIMLLTGVAVDALADQVVLTGGKTYHGSILSMDDQQVVLRDHNGVEMRIPRHSISAIHMGDVAEHSAALPPAPKPTNKQRSFLASILGDDQADASAFRGLPLRSLADALKAAPGEQLRLHGRYGRLHKNHLGLPQQGRSWYINDGERELHIVGVMPSNLSSFSREHWGSEVEVAGRMEQGKDAPIFHAAYSRLIKRRQSSMPTHY